MNVIGVTELYYYANSAAKQSYKTFESFAIACVIYFILTFSVTRLLRLVEKLLEGKKNYTIFGSQSDPDAEIHVKGGDA